MKIFKDGEGVEICEFSSQECEDKDYAIFVVTEDRGYNNIKEYVNQCLWEVQDNAERDGKKFLLYEFMVSEVVKKADQNNIVAIFTDSNGYEWYDSESKYGRVCLDENHVSEMVIECDVLGYSRNFGAKERFMNFRPGPIDPPALAPRADDDGEGDIPF